VDALVRYGSHVTRVSQMQVVGSWDATHRLFDRPGEGRVAGDPGQVLLMVRQPADAGGEVVAEPDVRRFFHSAWVPSTGAVREEVSTGRIAQVSQVQPVDG